MSNRVKIVCADGQLLLPTALVSKCQKVVTQFPDDWTTTKSELYVPMLVEDVYSTIINSHGKKDLTVIQLAKDWNELVKLISNLTSRWYRKGQPMLLNALCDVLSKHAREHSFFQDFVDWTVLWELIRTKKVKKLKMLIAKLPKDKSDALFADMANTFRTQFIPK